MNKKKAFFYIAIIAAWVFAGFKFGTQWSVYFFGIANLFFGLTLVSLAIKRTEKSK